MNLFKLAQFTIFFKWLTSKIVYIWIYNHRVGRLYKDCPYSYVQFVPRLIYFITIKKINQSRYKFKSYSHCSLCVKVYQNTYIYSQTFQNGHLPTELDTVKNRLFSLPLLLPSEQLTRYSLNFWPSFTHKSALHLLARFHDISVSNNFQ